MFLGHSLQVLQHQLLVNPNAEDSIKVIFPVTGEYIFDLSASDGICTWFTKVGISIAGVPDVYGTDIYICTETDSIYTADMDASPSYFAVNGNDLSTWWSVILDDESEHVFPNGCIPDDGQIATGFIDNLQISSASNCVSCASVGPGYSLCGSVSANSPRAEFTFNKFADKVFIWHVVHCGTTYTDSVYVSFGYEEPFANAGQDATVSCQLHELQGNISISSAGNSGCSIWSQLSGPATIPILNNQSFYQFCRFHQLPRW